MRIFNEGTNRECNAMSKGQKVLTTTLWGLLVLVMVFVISAGMFRANAEEDASPVQGVSASQPTMRTPAPDFALLDQDGKPLTTQSLRGQVWVADFIFTHCAGPCRSMTERMAALQKQITDPDVKFVSFSVDPERDTPSVLKTYGEQFKADQGRWKFLTGDKDTIYATARGMLVAVVPGTENTPLQHSERFLLVDADGNVRLTAHASDEVAMKKLVTEAASLAADARKAAGR